MKKILVLLLIVIAGVLVYRYAFKKDSAPHEKPKPLAVSKHSDLFNQSVKEILTHYYALTDAFVNWDSTAVNKNATALQESLIHFKADELKKDTAIYQTIIFPWDNAKNSATSVNASAGWDAKHKALQDISDNLRMMLLTVKYDQGVAYWQECPMAFGEGHSGNWLSASEEVINPYLGINDPKYGKTMLNCGETKSVIDFTGADSTVTR